MSRLFSRTLREAPADAEVAGHQLLLRAGFIRQLASGVFSYLPLARRSMNKIEAILRREMDAIGGQELTMPVVHPAEIWKETGRWYEIDAELGRFADRGGRDMVLAMTHEEVVADLVRREINSYRQLPQLIYHIQTKWRDDPRPRSGLIRVREFTMKDSYSLDADHEGLEKQYRAHYQAYFNIFNRCGLPVRAVRSDVGVMGGSMAHEYIYLTPVGEDTIILCDACGYAANRQVALCRKRETEREEAAAVEKIATPGTTTIEALARFLDIPERRTAKAVFMMGKIAEAEEEKERLVLALVRGDMEVNETKLSHVLKARALRPARDEEIRAAGAEPGYASAIGLKGALVVADELLERSPNLVAGANEEGFHLRNVNCGRDYQADVVCDIAVARAGDACVRCGGALRAARGVEVGNIFQLGTRYSAAMKACFLGRDGREKPVVMGSYGIGVGRLLACIAEEHRDERGLVWPVSVAPFQVHLVSLARAEGAASAAAEKLYAELEAAAVEVLLDERSENAGVKFNDADLIGAPLRLTLGERSLKKGVAELKLRRANEGVEVPLAEVVSRVKECIEALHRELEERVQVVGFEA